MDWLNKIKYALLIILVCLIFVRLINVHNNFMIDISHYARAKTLPLRSICLTKID